MGHWLYVEPVVAESSEPVWKVYSEDAILAEYWETWMRHMMNYNTLHGLDKHSGVNPIRCINDWTTSHWAIPATPENLLNIISAPKPQLI